MFYTTKKLAACLCLCLVLASAAWAEPASQLVRFGDGDAVLVLGESLQYTTDAAGTMSFADVQAEGVPWQAVTEPIPSFGWGDTVYWFRVRLMYDGDQARASRLLEFGYPLLDSIRVYVGEGDRFRQVAMGDLLPFAARPVAHPNFLLPLVFEPGQSRELFIRLQTQSAVQMPIRLIDETALIAEDHRFQLAQGLYFGVMLVMFFYNLFLYSSIRDSSYLLYCVLVASVASIQAAFHGYGFEYFWPNNPGFQQLAVPLGTAMTSLSFAVFAISFLDLKRQYRAAFYLLSAIALLQVALMLATPWFAVSATTRAAASMGAITSVLLIAIGLHLVVRGYKPARYFTLAFSVFLAGTVLLVLNKLGVLERSVITENAQQFGSGLEVMLLSFALGYRIKLLREEKEALQQHTTAQLEASVRSRTEELSQAMAALESANSQLHELSTRDGLTGAFNRRYFDQRLDEEIKRSQRRGEPLTLLLMDIDHFKTLNDNHGHQAGDACLQQVAATLQTILRDGVDCLARYGGEEFAVILPNTDAAQAEPVAERALQTIRGLRVSFEGTPLSLTVSIGLALHHPDQPLPAHRLVGLADTALYAAKQQGRDRLARTAATV